MSEYQYYEFRAIDRPLSNKEMRELRSHSTRARITPTSFINHYEWGSFKGDVDAWMEKYFDAFLYLANWGTRILKLRLPSSVLDAKTAKEYCSGDCAVVTKKAGIVIVSFTSEDEDTDYVDEDEMTLSSLISLRGELAGGDLRALYVGWLLCVQAGEIEDRDLEPPVPAGLGQLSSSQENLVELLRVDRDLLTAAAQNSPSFKPAGHDRDDVRNWVTQLPATMKDELLTKLIIGGDSEVRNELIRKLLKERSISVMYESRPPRSAGELLRAAESSAAERRRIEMVKQGEANARRQREIALAREKYLDNLANSELSAWEAVEALIATKQPNKYDEAIKLLVDLRDLDARKRNGDFRRFIEELRRTHARKPSFIQRLNSANLDSDNVPTEDNR